MGPEEPPARSSEIHRGARDTGAGTCCAGMMAEGAWEQHEAASPL